MSALEELQRDLARRLDQEDKVLLALHIGCGALALGMDRVEPHEHVFANADDTGNLLPCACGAESPR